MQNTIKEIMDNELERLIISNTKNKDVEYKKIVVRPVLIKNEVLYQFEKYTEKQVFHSNETLDECQNSVIRFMEDFRQCDAFTKKKNYVVKISKKGKVFVSSKVNTSISSVIKEHNRTKNYLIPDGTFIEPLYDLGIFTKEGKVVSSMYDKYKQINRFIEMIDDAISEDIKHLNIIDFGCGKSYLTFILYYYLVYIKKISVYMVGLDLKADVIKNCNEVAKKYGYDNLEFKIGDINGYKSDVPIDMVISLHACDTATDYALYNAIKWNAKMIFSVPCCQHEINGQIHSDNFGVFTKYGLLKERMAALMTDQIRANLLESESYKVQVLEFIDMAHSPKNILLRCIKSDKISDKRKAKAIGEVEKLMEEFKLEPTLYKLLKDN